MPLASCPSSTVAPAAPRAQSPEQAPAAPPAADATLLRNLAKMVVKEVLARRRLADGPTTARVGRAVSAVLRHVGAGLQALSLVVTTAPPAEDWVVSKEALRLTESWTIVFPQGRAARAPQEGQVSAFFASLHTLLGEVRLVARSDLNRSFILKASLDGTEGAARAAVDLEDSFMVADQAVDYGPSPHMRTLRCGEGLMLRVAVNSRR
eukprot:TRINITY_DN974_c0_g1_i1.p1 TRINITY_DN974_c0_g1~~TRINITY_DN974_c0_g1_i1.p1  ORF type:complete len:208 (+),score=45.55 TRINITY_DN974_c0_g1_i1:526-1149(+)